MLPTAKEIVDVAKRLNLTLKRRLGGYSIVNKECCAVAALSVSLGSKNGGFVLADTVYGLSYCMGLSIGFEGYENGNIYPNREEFQNGYEVGKDVRELCSI